ncbi:MAG: hypothetical protein FWB91_06630 [Defluviitaleaceae bacterium]|nr:hypothetical protein [Defluviitaleaceae bacterium]
MGELVFMINGVDFRKYVTESGLKIMRNDIESQDAGEMMDGTIRRDRIMMRRRIELTIKDGLSTEDISTIFRAVWPQFVFVQFLDPLEGEVITREFYISTVPSTVMTERAGKVMWAGFSFNMIETGVPYNA